MCAQLLVFRPSLSPARRAGTLRRGNRPREERELLHRYHGPVGSFFRGVLSAVARRACCNGGSRWCGHAVYR